MDRKQSTTDRLLARFHLLEQAWQTLRESVIKDVRAFEACKRAIPSGSPPPVLAALPRGPGLNPHPGPAEAARAFAALADARYDTCPALLDEKEECVAMGRDSVRAAWSQTAGASSPGGSGPPQHDPQGGVLDRGRSGNATSAVDAVHVLATKLAYYAADALHLAATIDELAWCDGEEDAESQGQVVELQCIVLDAAPALDALQALNHHLALDREVRLYEATESPRVR